MRVWEFAQNMYWTNMHDAVIVKRGEETVIKTRICDMPKRENPKRRENPKLRWADEHILAVHMDAKRHPGTMHGYTGYTVTIELFGEENL